MSLTVILVLVFLIGVVCGLRSMMGLAVVCWGARLGWLQLDHSHLAFLHTTVALVIFTLFAAGELVADKTPKIPSRTTAGPLVVRMFSGGLCGAALAFAASLPLFEGVLLGVIGAVVGTFAGYYVRRSLTSSRRLPDLPVALVEDLIAVGLGLFVVSRFVPAIRVAAAALLVR